MPLHTNQCPTLKPAYMHNDVGYTSQLPVVSSASRLNAHNAPPRLPLATPEDSDLDTSSTVGTVRVICLFVIFKCVRKWNIELGYYPILPLILKMAIFPGFFEQYCLLLFPIFLYV